jgi:SAM-dependent methyltransferase
MQAEKDFLGLQLRDMPYFRAVLRAVEARFYQDYPLTPPVLDLGCGDGHFATIAFGEKLDAGVDPWTAPLREAAQRGAYRLAMQAMGNRIPFAEATFASAVSNSVLEHIPDVDSVLAEMGRVVRPGGLFLFCVPNHNFLTNLSISNFLDRTGLKSLGNAYRRFFNRISRHQHCDAPEVWKNRLEKSGFRIEKWWHYFSPSALHVLEWGHYFGLPSLVSKKLSGRWVLVRASWNLVLTRKIVKAAYEEASEQAKGSYTFYVARRVQEIEAPLSLPK